VERDWDTCPRTGKIRQRLHEAHNAMEGMRCTDPRQDLLEVYSCTAGEENGANHWHVGHRDVGGRTRPWHPPIRQAPPLTYRPVLPPHVLALALAQESPA